MRALRPGSLVALLCALALAGSGCERAETGSAPAPAARPAPEPVPEAAPPPVEPAAARGRHERPLPAFSGRTFDGRELAISEFLGRRLLVYFFDASRTGGDPAAEAVARLAKLQVEENFRIVGIATGAPTSKAREFVARHGLGFPILNDASGAIGRRFGLDVAAALLFVDPEGYVLGAMGAVADEAEDPSAAIETAARERLRLPPGESGVLEPALGEYPMAPAFRGTRLDGEAFDSASLEGRPAVLIFFLHTCSHCHHALAFLKGQLPKIPAEKRPALLGISVSGSTSAVRSSLREQGLDFFPALVDPDRAIQNRFVLPGGVPDILLVDAEGRIRFRTRGWRDDRDPALLRMRLAQLAGEPVPMLLHQTGFSGNEFCAVCHEGPAETWRFTKHAKAFDTLVRHSEERNAECVGCHVVGFGKPGGWAVDYPAPHLEDVGCETCHGRGGPHQSPDHVADGDYSTTCAACHDAKHSLGFDYASFGPRVSHAANAHLLDLPLAEKRTRVAALGESRGALFPDAAYVGSEACRSCHEAEFDTWKASPHAKAVASLEAQGQAGDAECLACHTTAYGKPGGFPAGAAPAAHPDLAAVGCESCHGPGGNHVAEGARRAGTIVSLGDKCDSCVILQICGACHDDANDPGFAFEVQEKIDAQRHGTIEPSTGPGTEALAGPLAEQAAILDRAFSAGVDRPSGAGGAAGGR